MFKESHFLGDSEHGPAAIPLFGKADAYFEKTASARLLPEVTKYIAALRPEKNSQYVLVNAMGAGEFFGSNINGDYFTEESLIHKPEDWTGNPVIDRIRAADWPYGFPTFYRAHPYAHHRNKDASKAFGEVELSAWNPEMRRVELVTRVDRDKCLAHGGQGTWDKLQSGSYPDVSMGTKVPFDTCSICLDWKMYKEALGTFDPKKHKHAGMAALEYHKKVHKIRGLSITRADYCQHALKEMSRIYPDGRKVFVYNDFPSFFDISFVFIGADRTAKTMLFIFSAKMTYQAPEEEEDGDDDSKDGKTASVDNLLLKEAFGYKAAKIRKGGEIDKRVIPSQFAGKAVPVLTRCEPDLPDSLIDRLSGLPTGDVLSTMGGMGVLMRPREFQRLILIQLGERGLADDMDSRGEVFRKSKDSDEPMGVGPESFSPALAEILSGLISSRSLLAPEIEQRLLLSDKGKDRSARAPSHKKELLDKIAAAYSGYRKDVMDLIPHSQHLLSSVSTSGSLLKLGSTPVHEIFSPLSVAYLQQAFDDEYGSDLGLKQANAGVEKGSPSKNTWSTDRHYI